MEAKAGTSGILLVPVIVCVNLQLNQRVVCSASTLTCFHLQASLLLLPAPTKVRFPFHFSNSPFPGIGFETVRLIAKTGVTVFLGARDKDLGETAARKLAAEKLDVRFVELDVTKVCFCFSIALTVALRRLNRSRQLANTSQTLLVTGPTCFSFSFAHVCFIVKVVWICSSTTQASRQPPSKAPSSSA